MGFNEVLRGKAYHQPFEEDTSQVMFNQELSESVYKNPESRDPFGSISTLSTIVHGDLHIPRAETKDDPLYAGRLIKVIYAFTKRSSDLFHPRSNGERPHAPHAYETTDWYSTIKQENFLHAALSWSGAFREFLAECPAIFSKNSPNALFLNTGDMAGDGSQKGDLDYAADVHEGIYGELRNILLEHYAREGLTENMPRIEKIQLEADHDFESTRARRDPGQIGWALNKFGQDASFLQSIGTENGILGVCTNLLQRGWQKSISDIAEQSLQRISQKAQHQWGILHPETVSEVEAYVSKHSEDADLTALLLPLIYYQEVGKRTQQQDDFITEAKELKHIVIAGHDPSIVRKLAIEMHVPYTTTFAGHRHIATGSEVKKQNISTGNGTMSLQSLIVGAAAADYFGYRIDEKPPLGYVFQFSAGDQYPEIHSLSVSNEMKKIAYAMWYL